jgi:hypothetical protein
MACNLASYLGECVPVPAGARPADSSTCPSALAGTCGLDGTCDGKGACRKYPRGTECKAGTCQGDSVEGIRTCDGAGNCSETKSQPCPPYTCDPKNNRCVSKCTTDSQCSSDHQCVAGSCGKSINGAECDSNDGCLSGFCVDHVCCNIACTGACVTCTEPSSKGRCTYLPTDRTDPACNGQDPSSCGRTGACDGAGRCTLYRENTVCAPSKCGETSEQTPGTCDGSGSCRAPQLIDCSPFLCSTNVCDTSCDPNGTDVCQPGHACVSKTVGGVTQGICGKRKNGQVCTSPDDCESGQCVDGVCCESACEGACRSCNLPGSPGRCLNVAARDPDPRKICKDQGADKCLTNGLCDGQGACANYPSDTVCGAESCSDGTYYPPRMCGDNQQCPAVASRTCSPYRCSGSVCSTSCVSDAQCSDGNVCHNNSCGRRVNGTECSEGGDCQSGFCAQGVCCDAACTGACMACNLAGSTGMCKPVRDGSPDPQGTCPVTDPLTCGTTGACRSGGCAFVDSGVRCKPSACVPSSTSTPSSSVTPASTCDGKGACITPPNQSCGGFICENGACKISCTLATESKDCVPPASCSTGSCGLKVNGAACSAAGQCQSGFCTEGVCCNSTCSDATSGGLCKTCKGTPTVAPGTCTNVPAGTADPKARCAASNAAAGDCSNAGTCDGGGKCQPWSTSTGCRKESCSDASSGSTHTLAATCDGKGACPAASVASCGSYVCSKTSPTCLNNCTADTDCANGLTCLKTNNRCGGKLAAGEACVADTDCGSGLVCSAEGVCCNSACTSGCQSCKLSGKLGTCSNIPSGSVARVTNPVTCAATGSGLCGQSGNCNGSNACESKATCTVDNSKCPADTTKELKAAGTCSSTATCDPVLESCGAFLCITGGKCATSCTSDNESTNCNTADGYSCIDEKCQKKDRGAACGKNSECANNQCVQGYCCDAATCGDGVCQSCAFAGSLGLCTKVAAGKTSGTCTLGCSDGVAEDWSCDGTGQCKLNGSTTCSIPTHCVLGACVNTCSTSVSCPTGYACTSDNTCKLDLGKVCSNDAECAKGFCVDGFCCDGACSGECKTCKATPGTCTNAPANLPNRTCKPSCSSDHSQSVNAFCKADGTCDPVFTICDPGATCSDATQTCSSACTASPDTCPANYSCASNNTCKLSLGQACTSGDACVQGFCVNSFCCDTSACASECDTVNNKLITHQCDSSGKCNTTVTQDCQATEVCQNLACVPAPPSGGVSGHRPAAKTRTDTQLPTK